MSRRARGFTLIELIIAFMILAVLMLIIIPNFIRAKAKSRLSGCEENLRNMQTALQLYAQDNNQMYPPSLETLRPQYLVNIPTCPGAGASAPYSTGYEVSNVDPVCFTITCTGDYHVDLLTPNFPRIILGHGVQER